MPAAWRSPRRIAAALLYLTCVAAAGAGGAVSRDAREAPELVLQVGHADSRNGISAAAFSPDGGLLATAGSEGTIKIWDARSAEVRAALAGHTARVNRLAFSSDGRTLATAASDGTARLWEARTGRLRAVLRGHRGRLFAAAFSADGKQAATSCFERRDDPALEVFLWDAAAGRLIHKMEGGPGWVNCLAFTPAGDRLLGGAQNGELKVWDAGSGRLLEARRLHEEAVDQIVVSPDGRLIATAGSFRQGDMTPAGSHPAPELMGFRK